VSPSSVSGVIDPFSASSVSLLPQNGLVVLTFLLVLVINSDFGQCVAPRNQQLVALELMTSSGAVLHVHVSPTQDPDDQLMYALMENHIPPESLGPVERMRLANAILGAMRGEIPPDAETDTEGTTRGHIAENSRQVTTLPWDPPPGEDPPLDKPLFHPDDDSDVVAAQQQLFRMQHPGVDACSSQRALVFSFDRAYWGLAANVHAMTLAMSYAFASGRMFLTRNPDHFNYAGRSCRRGWECYFKPVSHCSESDIWGAYTVDLHLHTPQRDYRGYHYLLNTEGADVVYWRNVHGPHEQLKSSEYVHWVPPQWRHRGLLWWRSQLARYLFRPKQFVLRHITARVRAMNWTPHCTGVHVRHGDKAYDVYTQGAKFLGLREYLERARTLAPDASRVFVSTDNPAIALEANNSGVCESFGLLPIVDAERRFNGSHVFAPLGVVMSKFPGFPGDQPGLDLKEYALDTIKNIWLLAQTDHFVGTVTSCFSKLVYELRIGMGQSDLGAAWTLDHDTRYPNLGWFPD